MTGNVTLSSSIKVGRKLISVEHTMPKIAWDNLGDRSYAFQYIRMLLAEAVVDHVNPEVEVAITEPAA